MYIQNGLNIYLITTLSIFIDISFYVLISTKISFKQNKSGTKHYQVSLYLFYKVVVLSKENRYYEYGEMEKMGKN